MTRFTKKIYIQALPNGEVRVIEPPMRNGYSGIGPNVYYNDNQEFHPNDKHVGPAFSSQSKPVKAQNQGGSAVTDLPWPSTVTNSPTMGFKVTKTSNWVGQIASEGTRAVLEWPQKALLPTTTLPTMSKAKRTTSYQKFLQSETNKKFDRLPVTAANKEPMAGPMEMTPTVPTTVSLITDSNSAPPPDASESNWSDFFASTQNPVPGPTPLPLWANNRGASSSYDELKRAKHQGVIIGAVLGSICGLIILAVVLVVSLNYKRWQRFRLEKRLYGQSSRCGYSLELSHSNSSQEKQYYKMEDSIDTIEPPGAPVESPFDDVNLLKINKLMARPPVPPQNTSQISRLYQACVKSVRTPTRVVSAPSCPTDPLNISQDRFVPHRKAPSPPGLITNNTNLLSQQSGGRSTSVVSTIMGHFSPLAEKSHHLEPPLPVVVPNDAGSGNSTAHSSVSNGTKHSGIYHLSDFTSVDEWGALKQFLFKSPSVSARDSKKALEKRPFWRKDLVSSLSVRNSSTSQPNQNPTRSSSIYSYYDIDELEQTPLGVKSKHSSFGLLPPVSTTSISFDFSNESADNLLFTEPVLPICHVIPEESDAQDREFTSERR